VSHVRRAAGAAAEAGACAGARLQHPHAAPCSAHPIGRRRDGCRSHTVVDRRDADGRSGEAGCARRFYQRGRIIDGTGPTGREKGLAQLC
jgi:hypothetical protein